MIIILNCKVILLRAKKKKKKNNKKQNKQTNKHHLGGMTIPKYPNSKLLIWIPNKQTTKVSYQTDNYNA